MYKLTDVLIETTWQCNLDCIHCGSDCGHRAAENELPIHDWMNVLSQLAEMKVEKVVFSGGEPTLKKGIGQLLLRTSGLGMKVGLISNGLVPFNKVLQGAIRESKPFAVGLSIDGMKETHNRIRGGDKSWQGIMRNISILQKIGTQICIVTTINRLNYMELPKLAKFLSMSEIDSWQLQLAMPSGRMKKKKAFLVEEDIFKEICEEVVYLRKQYPKLNIQAADCFGPAPKETIRPHGWSGCTAGISSMAIDARGFVMPCLTLQEGMRTENVREKHIKDIWENSDMFDFNRKFRAEDVEGKCEDCKYLEKCGGGCNSQSFLYYGVFHNSPFCFARSFC